MMKEKQGLKLEILENPSDHQMHDTVEWTILLSMMPKWKLCPIRNIFNNTEYAIINTLYTFSLFGGNHMK